MDKDNTIIEQFWGIYGSSLKAFADKTELRQENNYIMTYLGWTYTKWEIPSTMKVSLFDLYNALYEFIKIKQNVEEEAKKDQDKKGFAECINNAFVHLVGDKACRETGRAAIEGTVQAVIDCSETIIGNIINFHFGFPAPTSDHPYLENNNLFNALVDMKQTPVDLLRRARNRIHPTTTPNGASVQNALPKRMTELKQMLQFAIFTYIFVVALCRKGINYRRSQKSSERDVCNIRISEGKNKQDCTEKYAKILKDYFQRDAEVNSVLEKFTPNCFTAYFSLEKQMEDALSVQWSVGERNNNVDGNELDEPIKIENLHRYETVVLDVILKDQTKKNITIDLQNLSSGVTYNVYYEDGRYTESRRVEAESRNKDIIADIYNKYEHGRTVTHQKYVCHFSLCAVNLDRGDDNNIVNIAWNVKVIFTEYVEAFDIGQITMPASNDEELISYGFTINEEIASIKFDPEEIRHDMLWEDDRHSDYFSDTITELDLRAYSGKTIRMGKRFTNLRRLYLGKGDVVSAESFRGCTKLKTVVVKGEGEYTIGDMAFYGCSSLKSIVVPQEFGNEAFAGCTALKDVSFQKGLKRIGNQAFEGCQSLKAIDMPDGLEEIGQGAFRHAGLEKILFPASVKKIRESAFYGCNSLEELCFPNGCGVEEMHDKAFMDCPNLKKIVMRDKEVTIQEYIDNYKPSVFEDVFDSSYSYEIFGPNKPNNFTRWLDAFMKNLEKTFEDL